MARNARNATTAEIEQAKRDYPKFADRIGQGMDVMFYNEFNADTRFVVESVVNASIYGSSSMWSKCGSFDTADAAVAHAMTMKNKERRVVKVVGTGRFIGDDRGGFCVENGYRDEVLGQRVYRKGSWIKSGVLA
ncbi:MAG: hypothetical protein KGR25_00020 [Chloroflexi bacterium]|nr:hypothetical protein [Chloroflexota bacterium]